MAHDSPSDIQPQLYYRMADTGPQLLKDILEKRGWLPYIEGETDYWNLWWKGNQRLLDD
jgi:hypothetical protein